MTCSYYSSVSTLLCLGLTSHWLPLPAVGDGKRRECELDDTLVFVTEACGLLKSYSTVKGPLLCYSVGGGRILAKSVERILVSSWRLCCRKPFSTLFISPLFVSHSFFFFAFVIKSVCFVFCLFRV